jgi:hypothetical protein
MVCFLFISLSIVCLFMSVYLHHETAQCFVKQARDFVLLAVERTEVRS